MPYSLGYARFVVGTGRSVKLSDPPAKGVPLPPGTSVALIQNADAATSALYWTDDGKTPPSASEGMIFTSANPVRFDGDLKGFQMIAASGPISVRVQFYASLPR